jgi:hypothetical protein
MSYTGSYAGTTGVRGKRPVGKVVGGLLPAVTKKAFARYGFPAAAILTDWPSIVGPEMASYTSPERLKWSRAAEDEEQDGVSAQRAGATLVLRVEGARSLDIQYRKTQLMERINAYFGFRALADVRIVQGPVVSSVKKPKPRPAPPKPIPQTGIADANLASALAQLAANVSAPRR